MINKITFFKTLKIVIVCIIIYFIYSLGNVIYLIAFKAHKPDIFSQAENNWIFNDKIKEKIDAYGSNWRTKRDVLSGFKYDLDENESKKIFINFWEFNDLKHKNIDKLNIHFNANLNNEKEPDEYEILDNQGDFSIVVRYDYNFDEGFHLNFPKSDSSVYFEKKPNLRFVYGKFNYITITNGKKEEQIVFRNVHSNNYTAFFVFRKNHKNYLALVHSDFYFGKDIAKIFSFYENLN